MNPTPIRLCRPCFYQVNEGAERVKTRKAPSFGVCRKCGLRRMSLVCEPVEPQEQAEVVVPTHLQGLLPLFN